ncbi:putative quinol monooxygenase, partial [Blastomonas fulva]|uniref:putative quinol monooxygenase n=1 Tax=Blastomonas fulva TaxID=1550728 RepID=UPI003F703D77
MTITRRPVLAGIALAMLGGAAIAKERGAMEEALYGLIGKMKAQPGKRADLIALLTQGTSDMPGCITYIVAEDA